MENEKTATKRTQSKTKIRALILHQLAHGKPGKKGTILKLLEKLDDAIEHTTFEIDGKKGIDIDALTKIAGAVLRLANLALPTAAQEEAITHGMPSGGAPVQSQNILVLIESHLAERRRLLSESIHTDSVVIQSLPNLSEMARIELAKRNTPPPTPAPGLGGNENVGRAPTIPPPSSPEIISGTNQPTIDIHALTRPVLDEDDLDFSEDE